MANQQKIQVNQIGNFYIVNDGGGSIVDNTLSENGLLINKINVESTEAALLIQQAASGAALQILNSGPNFDILAGNGNFAVSNAGHMRAATVFIYNAGSVPYLRLQDNVIIDLQYDKIDDSLDFISSSSGTVANFFDKFIIDNPIQILNQIACTPTDLTSVSNQTTINALNGNTFHAILTENTTFLNPLNVAEGATYVFIIEQAASGSGPFTVTFDTNFLFSDGDELIVSSGANAIDVLTSYAYSSTQLISTYSQNFQ